jgi:hypothetical protein
MCTAEWWKRLVAYRMVEFEEMKRREKKRGKKRT